MHSDRPQITPERAREQLAEARTRSLRSGRDHTLHAAATAAFGLSSGLLAASQNVVSGASEVALTCAFVAACLAVGLAVERVARTVPRRARLRSRLGIGASLLLALVVVLPWLNLQAQTEPNTWPMVLVAAVVIAVPSLVAAAVIARGRR